MEQPSHLFLYGLVFFFIAVFLFNAFRGYKGYKNSIYPYLYSNYLIDFFYNYSIFKDNSKSGLLTDSIGKHRMIFAQISDANGVPISRFVTVIHNHGVTLISYFNPHGSLTGADTDKKWTIKRDDGENIKGYKIDNPFAYLRQYEQHLKDVTEVSYVDKIIAIGGNEPMKVNVPCKLVRYEGIVDALKESDAGYALNEVEIEELFQKLK